MAEQANLLLRLAQCRLGHRGAPLRAPPAAGMVTSDVRTGARRLQAARAGCPPRVRGDGRGTGTERWSRSGRSEGRLVGEVAARTAEAAALRAAAVPSTGRSRGGRGPRVVDRAAEAASALPGGAVDLRRRVAQGGTDLVDLDLVGGALLTFLGLPLALAQTPLHDHSH